MVPNRKLTNITVHLIMILQRYYISLYILNLTKRNEAWAQKRAPARKLQEHKEGATYLRREQDLGAAAGCHLKDYASALFPGDQIDS